MNKKFLAVICAACVLLCSCGNVSDKGEEDKKRTTLENDTVEPVQGNALSTQKHGYGQGVEVDENNRPTGAVSFNAQYGKYNAQAIMDSDDKILLTFDQGYENGLTAQILDTLKEKNVKAVFFVLQDYAQKNPELVQRMLDEGHVVGNHSVSHYSMPELSEQRCREEIMGMQEYMQENFDCTMTLFRPPMGEYSEQSLAVTNECGFKTVLWSYAYEDWDTENQPDENESLNKLLNAAHGGAIYLLHSVSQTNADILSDFIDGIRKQGFEFQDPNS